MEQLTISKVIDQKEENKEEQQQEELVEGQLADDFYYKDSDLPKRQKISIINDDIGQFDTIFGHNSYKKDNFRFVSENEIIYSNGLSYVIVNLETKQQKVLRCRDGGGIGSIAIHPTYNFIAIGEKGESWPNIYIYDYPELDLYRVLRKGTEKSYSHIIFSMDGTQLASVGNSPDYQLSIWDWKKEQIMLKAKAFSQEIYKIVFSQYQFDVLATMGMGHVKFWRIAETFTGLKLKGEIAKYGTQEISDVIACYHFPDGKVLSSTEYGNLILWEGNLIKCVLFLEPDVPLHKESIEVIFVEDEYIITAGQDGYIRYWSHQEIDNSEPDDNFHFFPKLHKQVYIGGHIVDIQRFKTKWVIYDKLGKLYQVENLHTEVQKAIKMDHELEKDNKKKKQEYEKKKQLKLQQQAEEGETAQVEQEEEEQELLLQEIHKDYEVKDLRIVLELNNGSIVGSQLNDNLLVSLSEDNRVYLFDLCQRKKICERQLDEPKCKGTTICQKPDSQLECALGFDNGLSRVTIINRDDEHGAMFQIIKGFKVFDNPVTHIRYSSTGLLQVYVSEKGEVFLMKNYIAYCLFEMEKKINDIQFNNMGNRLLLALEEGSCIEIEVPNMEDCDTSETYLNEARIVRQQTIKMLEFQKPKDEDMDIDFFIKKKNTSQGEEPKDVEWEPNSINRCIYYDKDCKYALVSVDGNYQGYLYVFDFQSERPIKAISIGKMSVSYLRIDQKESILFIGNNDGKVQLRNNDNAEEYWLQLEQHDQDTGRVNMVGLNQQKNLVVSCSDDGTVMVRKMDYPTLQNQFKGLDFVQQYNYSDVEQTSIKEQRNVYEVEIKDSGQYCIQQEKLLLNEDMQRKEADKKKNLMRAVIQQLRERFEKIQDENDSKSEVIRLSEYDMVVDNEYQQIYQQRMEDDIEETRKVLEYDIQYNIVRTEKIKKFMIDELVVDSFVVKVIRNPKIQVKTFKLQKMSQYLQDQLELYYKEIEDQQSKENNVQVEKQEVVENQTKQEESVRFEIDLKQLDKEYDMQLEQKGYKEGAQKRKEKRKMLEETVNKALEELQKTQPTRESFDPDHKKEISEATQKFGDYKLKSDPQYVVPEHQRMNVNKKRKHLFLLEQYIYTKKLDFNNEVIQLRELKKFTAQKVEANNKKIREINRQLGVEEELVEVVIDKDSEYPESRFELEQEEEKEKNKEMKEKKEKKDRKKLVINANIKNRKGYKVEKSEVESMEDQIREMKLKAEKKKLKDEMDSLITECDSKVIQLINEKNNIEVELMVARMKLVTYYQELLVLVDMEEKDNNLIEQLLELRKEKQNLEEQTIQIINQLLGIKDNESKLDKTLLDLMKQFKELIHPDDDIARNKIHEHYRKQFRQKKAKLIKQSNDDEEEMNEDEESENEEDFEEEEEDDDKPDTTPIESDPKSKEIIERIVQLEDEYETSKKHRQELEGNKKQITNKTNQLMVRLENTENEIKDYQRVKLQKLNKIDVSVVLGIHQIQNMFQMKGQWLCPDDLNSSILFTQKEMDRLATRIVELEQERKKTQANRDHLKKKKLFLDKELKQINNEYIKHEKDYEEKHMLKFGYIMDKDNLDLKFLEAFEPTKQVIEMRQKFQKEENLSIRKIEEAKQKLMGTKKKLLEAKKQNTLIINNITKLGQQQIDLDKKLDSINNKLFKEQNENQKKNSERDKANLKELVKFLNKLIEDLKTEIGIFKRKGGHIYTLVNNNQR